MKPSMVDILRHEKKGRLERGHRRPPIHPHDHGTWLDWPHTRTTRKMVNGEQRTYIGTPGQMRRVQSPR